MEGSVTDQQKFTTFKKKRVLGKKYSGCKWRYAQSIRDFKIDFILT